MSEHKLRRWTRDGIFEFSWTPYESFEKLILTNELREKVTQRLESFSHGKEEFQELQLPWRYGVFFYGPSGCGKTAAGRAIARWMKWDHLTIPAHEILDSHLFERALADSIVQTQRVIVLEDVDLMVRVMEPETFFTLLDHAMERAEGTFWIANSRHPEHAPKTQLLRPGRFDEAIRLEPPGSNMRGELLRRLFSVGEVELDDSSLLQWVEDTNGLTFSHFEELRQITARMKLDRKDPSEFTPAVKSYVEDQLIAGDRWGGLSDQTEELQQRVHQVDARILMAALDMTDVFRTLIEKVIGDAAEQAKFASNAGED